MLVDLNSVIKQGMMCTDEVAAGGKQEDIRTG